MVAVQVAHQLDDHRRVIQVFHDRVDRAEDGRRVRSKTRTAAEFTGSLPAEATEQVLGTGVLSPPPAGNVICCNSEK